MEEIKKDSGNCPGNGQTEVWLPVPETGWRYAVSSSGRLFQLGRKERHGKKTIATMTGVEIETVCDVMTGEMGWHVYIDGKKFFWRRDHLMKLFGERTTAIPVELDEKARKLRDKIYRQILAEKRDEGMPGNMAESVY